MNTNRIIAIMYRHLKPTLRDPMRLMDMFYWPLLDIVLWGFTSLWLGTLNPENPHATTMMLSALVMWQVVFRSSIEVTRNMLEELWHQNFINLFASPLQFSEWLLGLLSISLVNSLWNLVFGAAMVYWFFGVTILSLGFWLVPFFLILLMFGWFCGLTACSVIFTFGRRTEMIAWSFPWLFATFSCVFYPIHVLPTTVQKISWCLPTTYVFESVRNLITYGQVHISILLTGFALGVLFLLGAITVLNITFRRAQCRGLNTLD